MEKKIQKICQDLFSLIGIEVEVSVKEEKGEDEQIYKVILETTRESGLLIGARGSTLNAIQSFLGTALKQKTGEWVRIFLDVGGWREKQEDRLLELADQAVKRVRETKEDQYLYNLSAGQRRVVHLAISKLKGVATESQGEGDARYLVVKLKK